MKHPLPTAKRTSPASRTTAPAPTRREALRLGGTLAAGSALAGVALPPVHAGEDNTIRLAIIGCGPRGTGAVGNAFSSALGPCKLVAMADIVPEKLDKAFNNLSQAFPDRMDVPPERRFIGFDAYRKAMDCLRPGTGDVAMLTTRAAFRPTHFDHAVAKGLNVFMEKSFAADPGGIRRILKTGAAAKAKGLKVACGLQCRHSKARQAMIDKIKEGAMGDLLLIRAYRMQGGGMMGPRKATDDELIWQIRQSTAVLWGSSGKFLENMIHQVDECCWLMDAWPVSAHGMGGTVPRSTDASQNFDHYAIEYTFPNGAKALVEGRFWANCHNEFATFAHGTRCAGQFSGDIHAATVMIHKDQRIQPENVAWQPPEEKVSPWQAEWDDYLEAIRKDTPYNETERSALSNLVGIMGRAACHSGRIITWEEAKASNFLFCAHIDELNEKSDPPLRPDAEGRYPAPIPGKWSEI